MQLTWACASFCLCLCFICAVKSLNFFMKFSNFKELPTAVINMFCGREEYDTQKRLHGDIFQYAGQVHDI